MVSLTPTALTAGTSVSQCAEITRIAFGRGKSAPSPAKNVRAGVSVNGSVGAPCERNRLGRDMAVAPEVRDETRSLEQRRRCAPLPLAGRGWRGVPGLKLVAWYPLPNPPPQGGRERT